MKTLSKQKIKGRAAADNPAGRYEKLAFFEVPEALEAARHDEDWEETRQIKTQIFKDTSRTIISTNDSPDVGMGMTLNPYRGCEHGCIYCFARPTHEYFGLSAGLDFETKIFVKTDAAKLLQEKLQSPKWVPRVIFMSGITDPYQPLERSMKITRGCLEVLTAFRNPVSFITKNYLVTRDLDLLRQLAEHQAVSVNISITTLDADLARRMEPRTSAPRRRLQAVEELSKAGIPVNVMMAPIVPGLTEHEIPMLLEAAANAGARSAHYNIMRLPYGVKDLFQTWVHEHYPDRADKILNRVRDMRGGKLNDSNFGSRLVGDGFYAEQIGQMFDLYKKRFNLNQRHHLSTAAFRRDAMDQQLRLPLELWR